VHVALEDGFRPPVGAVVDVLAAFDAASSPDRAAATVVASGARVIGVDDAADSSTGGGSSVTLLVTQDEVADVAYAGSTGTITLALAPPEAFHK
jgi:Flp pilus assembly protein CpaB